MVLPFFTSCFSFRSILTLEEPIEPLKEREKRIELKKESKEFKILSEEDYLENRPKSIFEIALREKLKTVFLVEDNFVGFLNAQKVSSKLGLKLAFGLRINFCNNVFDNTDYTKNSYHKNILFAKNEEGYLRLLKIYSAANRDFHYNGSPRMDYKELKKHWSNDIILTIPFYNSFLYKNSFTFSSCIPELDGFNPVFCLEENNLLIDDELKKIVTSFCDNRYNIIKTKSIFYDKREDFLAYQVYEISQKREVGKENSLYTPNLDDFYSDEFCIDSWKEANKK